MNDWRGLQLNPPCFHRIACQLPEEATNSKATKGKLDVKQEECTKGTLPAGGDFASFLPGNINLKSKFNSGEG